MDQTLFRAMVMPDGTGIAAQTEMERRIRTFLFAPQAMEKHAQLAKAIESGSSDPMAGIARLDMKTASLMPLVFKEFGTVASEGVDYSYIRITTFAVDDDQAFISEFMHIVKMLPKNGLIVDVRGNGGGLIAAGERLLQVLTPGPVSPNRSR